MEMVRFLCHAGAKINPVGEVPDVPLTASIQANNTEALVFLLEHGANHVYTNACGNTVLHSAAIFGSIETIGILASRKLHGLDVLKKNRRGRTAIQEFENRDGVSDELKMAFRGLLSSVELPRASQGDPDDDEADVFVNAVESWNI